ncbi:TIGR04222 domain-containing membrane protein [Archangium sp.]|uniref:TIGR04222 domain-containing membrane protein n=1 Tax=Archangium sp. TaxID=1872627 RepID=UPI00286C400D|nr:TIGR04222 domain-containing membrane protein [Archangium sp.]
MNLNPLDWSGPQFLMGYAVFLVVAFVAARVCQHLLRTPAEPPGPSELDMDPYEVAALQDLDTVTQTVVATLVRNGQLSIADGNLRVTSELPSDAHRLEKAVYRKVKHDEGATPTELHAAVKIEMAALERALHLRGFLLPREQARRLMWTSLLIFTAALGLGVLKVLIGIGRDRPVAFLVFLLLFATGLGYSILVTSGNSRRSRRGDAALKLLREENQPLLVTVASEGPALSSGHLAMAVALFGTSALAGSSHRELRTMLAPSSGGVSDLDSNTSSFSDSSSSSSSSSDSSSCGGGGGCGGCGGGGGD